MGFGRAWAWAWAWARAWAWAWPFGSASMGMWIAVTALSFASTGCGDECSDVAEARVDTLDEALETIADIAYAAYGDSLSGAETLRDRVDDLLDDPSETTLRAARIAWLDAREPYGQTEAFRFQAGPIDALREDEVMGMAGDGPEGRINAWPLAEAVIDYVHFEVDGDEETDPFPPPGSLLTTNVIYDNKDAPNVITAAYLDALNGLDADERSVLTGYHAIEFLLWGQDLNETMPLGSGPRDATPGQRTHDDYFTNASGSCLDGAGYDDTCDARRRYLRVVTDLLIDDLDRVHRAWAPDVDGNYRETFVEGREETLETLMFAMGEFIAGELAGERIQPALEGGGQEEEHSCFSDNTHRDIVLNTKGVRNLYRGEYSGPTPVSGTGIYDVLVARGFEAQADALDAAIENAFSSVLAINDAYRVNGMPFDLLIENDPSQPVVLGALIALVNQGDETAAAYNLLFEP